LKRSQRRHEDGKENVGCDDDVKRGKGKRRMGKRMLMAMTIIRI
jgi:hypothetical protein